MKEASWVLVPEIWPHGEASGFLHDQELIQVLSGHKDRWIPSLLSPSASLQLRNMSQKGANTLVQNPNFCDCCSEDTSTLPGSGGQRGLHSWSYNIHLFEVHTFAYLKSCCYLRVWLPIRLNLSAD